VPSVLQSLDTFFQFGQPGLKLTDRQLRLVGTRGALRSPRLEHGNDGGNCDSKK
jgi:hypothetical protein